jgi:acyl carrier protein
MLQTDNENKNIPTVQKMAKESASERDILEYLTESLAEALYIEREELDPDKVFTEMGMDSIIAVEWIKAINNKYGSAVAATKIYEHPNVRELAGFMVKELNENTIDIKENRPEPALVPPVKPEQTLMPDAVKPGNISLDPLAEVQVFSPQPAASVKPVNNALQEAGSIAMKNSEEIPVSTGEKLSREHVSEGDILEYLTESLAEALYIEREELDPDKVFTEMGMDSIIAVEWIKAINNKYGSAVAATKIYEHPNVRDLAGFMVKELNENTIDIIESRLEPELIPPVKPEQTLMPDAAKPGNISLSPVTEAQVFSPQPAAPVKPVNNALQEAGSIALKNSEDIPASSGEKFSREHISERDILEYLTESLAEALYIEREELDPDKIFTELGMDSIIAVEWIKAINNKYGINVAATKVYDHPNLSGLAGFLAGQFNKDIE